MADAAVSVGVTGTAQARLVPAFVSLIPTRVLEDEVVSYFDRSGAIFRAISQLVLKILERDGIAAEAG